METYEKIDNQLKITTTETKEEITSLEELKLRKANLEQQLAQLSIDYQTNKVVLEGQINIVDQQIVEATKLGLVEIEVIK